MAALIYLLLLVNMADSRKGELSFVVLMEPSLDLMAVHYRFDVVNTGKVGHDVILHHTCNSNMIEVFPAC